MMKVLGFILLIAGCYGLFNTLRVYFNYSLFMYREFLFSIILCLVGGCNLTSDKKPSSDKQSFAHYRNSIALMQEAFDLEDKVFNAPYGEFAIEDSIFQLAILLRKKALEEARLVQLKSLNYYGDSLAEHYSSEFILGLENYISGTEPYDNRLMNDGNALIQEFGDYHSYVIQKHKSKTNNH